MQGSGKDIGLWVTPENVIKPKDKHVVGRASRLLGRGRELIIKNM